jgi:hypothetical protein
MIAWMTKDRYDFHFFLQAFQLTRTNGTPSGL